MDYHQPPSINQITHIRICQHPYKSSNRPTQRQEYPKVFLWVWRYDADMQWIDRTKCGIAYLAGTIKVGKKGVSKYPRLNSLKVPDNTSVEAVIRIEAEPGFILDSSNLPIIQKSIESLIPSKNISALQIDFDATRSQRKFYKHLLEEIRATSLPSNLPLNMTALASWTIFDKWTADMPVNSVVPMFFRMGKDRHKMISCLKKGMVKDSDCLGLAVDEPDVFEAVKEHNLLKGFKRFYLFSPGGWGSSKSKSFAKNLNKKIY